MYSTGKLFSTLVVVLSLASGGTARAGLMLPDTSLALEYGNFFSFSLPYLQYLADNNFIPSGDYNVASTPGAIKDSIVIGTGAGGESEGADVISNFNGMNDAYDLPGPGSGVDFYDFSAPANDPGSGTSVVPLGDTVTAWNADVKALNTFLKAGGGDFAMFFNLNETGTAALDDAGLKSTDLLAWAVVTLSDPIKGSRQFFFSNFDDPFGAPGDRQAGLDASMLLGGPEADPLVNPTGTTIPTLDPQWGIAHSVLTVNPSTGGLIGFGPVGGGVEIKQNLGAKQAAFVVYNAELDSLIKSEAYRDFSFEFRMSRINNGFEQIFLLNDTVVSRQQVVPEPGAAVIWACLGIVGLVVNGRRRSTKN